MTAGQVLRELMEFGRTGQATVPSVLADPQAAHDAFRREDMSWLTVAKALDADEFENLIRGLVLYGRWPHRSLGPALSPVVSLYFLFELEFPEREPPLTQWIIAHRVNPYEPFGERCEEGVTSHADHKARQRAAIRRTLAS